MTVGGVDAGDEPNVANRLDRTQGHGFDLRDLLQNAPFALAADLVDLGLRAVLSIALARYLGKDGFGVYAYVTSALGLLAIASLPSVDAAVAAAAARGEERTFGAAIALKSRFSLLGVPALGLLALVASVRGQHQLALALALASALFVPYSATSLFAAVDVGKRDFAQVFQMRGSVSAANCAAAALAAVLLGDPAAVIAVGLVAASAAQALHCWRVVRRRLAGGVDWASLRFAKRITIVNLVMVFASYGDRILIAHLLSLRDLALFTVASVLPTLIRRVTAALLQVEYARLAGLPQVRARQRALQMLPWLGLGGAVMAAVAIAILPQAIELLYSREYGPAVPIAQGFVVVQWIMTLLAPLMEMLFIAHRMETAYASAVVVYATTTITLDVALIPFFGLWGAVLASGGAALATLVHCIDLTRRGLAATPDTLPARPPSDERAR